MAVLPIRLYPDPVLREPAAPVPVVDDAVRKLVADMTETMHAAEGAGLAAPQVGVQRRVLVYHIPDEEEVRVRVLVNPEIVSSFGEQTSDEGCLSIPGLAYPVTRAQTVRVRGVDTQGESVEYDAGDFEARVIQHEVDHLDGVLYIDRIDREMRREALRVLRERALDGGATPVARGPGPRI